MRNKVFLISFFFSIAISSLAQINTDRVLMIGRNALYYEDYVLAISYFNKVIRVKPYLADPYYFRAYGKFSLEDYNGAKQDMDQAIDINPFHAEFFRFRGDIKNRLGEYKGALNDYQEGLNLKPNSEDIYFNRGLAYMQLKQYDKSEKDFSEVLRIDRGQYGAYINRAISRLNLKDTTNAVADMEQAIKVNPLVADAQQFSASIYYQIGQYAMALSRINEAIRLDYKQAMYYMLRGSIRYQLDDLRGTLEDFNRVVEIDPRNTMAYSNRGILRAEIGDINNAIDDFSRVLALNPNDLLTLYSRALLYLKTGDYYEAINDLSIIIDYYPNYSDAYRARSQAYTATNQSNKAQLDYNTALKIQLDKRNTAMTEAEADKADEDEDGPKHKDTRNEKDTDINNYNKIVVLDDFGIDETEAEDVDNIRGKVQNRNIIIDLEPMFGLTFFSSDSLVNRTRYFKPEVTQFNLDKPNGKTLIFSNRESESDQSNSLEYFHDIENITKKLPDSSIPNKLLFARGVYYCVVVNYSSAISDYSTIIDNQKLGYFAYFNRAYTRFKMVEFTQSITKDEFPTNTSIPVLGKDNSGLTNNNSIIGGGADIPKTEVVEEIYDYELIENDLRKVIELNPEFEFAYYNLGILKCIEKDYDEAVKLFDKALEVNPFFAEAYYNRGLTKIFLKKNEEGVMDLSKAGELGMYKAYNVIKRYGEKPE